MTYVDLQEKALDQMSADAKTFGDVTRSLNCLHDFCSEVIDQTRTLVDLADEVKAEHISSLIAFKARLHEFEREHLKPWKLASLQSFDDQWMHAQSLKQNELDPIYDVYDVNGSPDE